MDQDTLIGVSIAGSIIFLIIIYQVIKSATGTTSKIQLMKMQVRLLGLIARKSGATDEEIKTACDLTNGSV